MNIFIVLKLYPLHYADVVLPMNWLNTSCYFARSMLLRDSLFASAAALLGHNWVEATGSQKFDILLFGLQNNSVNFQTKYQFLLEFKTLLIVVDLLLQPSLFNNAMLICYHTNTQAERVRTELEDPCEALSR